MMVINSFVPVVQTDGVGTQQHVRRRLDPSMFRETLRQQPGGGHRQLNCFAAADRSEPISWAGCWGPTVRKAKSPSLLGPPGQQDSVTEGRQSLQTWRQEWQI